MPKHGARRACSAQRLSSIFSVFLLPYAVFKVQCFLKGIVADSKHQVSSHGGLKWTRTTDLALIRRTL